ncbi:MAG: family 16 glycoside hydrolase, partial [Chthoniobacteraceae bacterium]
MRLFILCVAFLLPSLVTHAQRVKLFDGQTLDGWEGETTKVWRVRDGTIVGGSLEGNPRNEFLLTKARYRNFSLRVEYKLVGTEGFVNGGVQFRSRRIANPPNEMIGYQADIGAGHSGALYDESRRRVTLAAPTKELITAQEKPGEWNRLEVICEGPRIRIIVNGKPTVDYAERESGIDDDGFIGLQIHGNCKAEIAFRNITIEAFPDNLVPKTGDILNRFGDGNAPSLALAPWAGSAFAMGSNEVIAFAGQENLVRQQADGVLEARLAGAFAAQRPRFRSMAWEADTVYQQWRDSNFGSWTYQLTAAGATIVMAQFGQMEAFDGVGKIPQFSSAFHRLLDQFAARTPRIVLLSPIPFETAASSISPQAPDLTRRNADVRAYADAVREIARQRGAIFIDLFTPLAARPAGSPRLTDNGVHLNAEGLRVVSD